MKTILVALNSQFIHSNLAVWNLFAIAWKKYEVSVIEGTINEPLENIYGRIIDRDFDVIGFSAYIWNIEEILKLASSIKKVRPEVFIFFGGPEVSFDTLRFLEENTFVDAVIAGEGEDCFIELLRGLEQGNISGIEGLFYRAGKSIISSQLRIVRDLNIIPPVYKIMNEYLSERGSNLKEYFENKIVYYESSRGCPFNCSYCLSSTIHSLRYYDIERVKEDLKILMNLGIKQIKFIDRTFNADRRYVGDLLDTILLFDDGKINIHLEIVASILDDELIKFFKKCRKGLFQFEIGVQSTNPKTLRACGRDEDFDIIKKRCSEIAKSGNIKQHLDLICGLPFEDIKSFEKSFDNVVQIGVDEVQLGFLKMLKGTSIRENSHLFGYKYNDYPPYEVLENNWLSYRDIKILKDISKMCDLYINSGCFEEINRNLFKTVSPFKHLKNLSDFWRKKGYNDFVSKEKAFEIYADFLIEKEYYDFISFLRLDFLLKFRYQKLPCELKTEVLKEKYLHDIWHMESVREKLSIDEEIPSKELVKHSECVRFAPEIYGSKWLLFYRGKSTFYCDITYEVEKSLNNKEDWK